MPMKGAGSADVREMDRFEGGVGWLAYPDEAMRRASHALATDGGVYAVDPVDADGVDDLLAEYGEVAGVVVLLDRHRRDAATLARRHGVAVHVPDWFDDPKLDAPVERLGGTLGGSYEVHRVLDTPLWQEAALHDGGTLVVPEALGTAPYYRTRDERVGVHPVLRPFPPRALGEFDVERLLVGHGGGVFEDAGDAIEDALAGSRRRMPRLYARALRSFVTG